MEGTEGISTTETEEKVVVLDAHRPAHRRRVNPGDILPDGTRKQMAMRNPEHLAQMRETAAAIAIDMERSIYVSKTGRQKNKPWKGPYSRWQIASELGFNSKSGSALPKIFDSPIFERYVEWERTKRDATFRASMRENLPLLDRVVSGMLLESAKRVLLEPDKIPSQVLFTEMRKMMVMKSEYEGAFRVSDDVQTVINDFQRNIKGLPEAARKIALEMFKQEILQLSSGANDAIRIIEGEFKAAEA